MHYTTAAEAVKLIRSNDSVYIQGSTSIPEALVAAMAERGGELEHVTVYSAFAVGAFDAPYCRPEYKESFLVNSKMDSDQDNQVSVLHTDRKERRV